jgi:hypothetical protein
MDPITVEFRYLQEDYLQAVRAHQRANLGLGNLLSIPIGAVAAAYFWHSQEYHWIAVLGMFTAAAFSVLYLAAFFIVPLIFFRSEPKFKDEYSLEFTDDGIHFKTSNLDSRINWSLYSSVRITRTAYVLYYGRRHFTVIPKRVFKSDAEQERFVGLIESKIPR